MKKIKAFLAKTWYVYLIISILAFATCGYFIYRHVKAKMPLSHVYVCDNPTNYSDFDNWVKSLTNWVPSYIIIKDGYVINVFEGGIDEDEFTDKLGSSVSNNTQIAELPNYSITNLEGARQSIQEIFKEGTYVLELHWIDCKDCIYQDENFTDKIYYKFGTDIFYRYYIKSEHNKVVEKYK